MSTALRPAAGRSLRGFSRGAAAAVCLLGVLVLLGWLFGVESLKRVAPSLASMKANTAVGFALTGAALWQRHAGRLRASRVLAGVALGIGLLTAAEYLFGWQVGVDQVLFRDAETGVAPGRPAPVTAINLVLCATALLAWDLRASTSGPRPREWLALAVCVTSLLSLLGYAYSVRGLYSIGPFTSVALHTAVGSFVLGLGILFATPDQGLARVVASDDPGGMLARRMLPAALLVPSVVGWIRWRGEQAGFYDTAFGLALFAAMNIVCFTTLTWWNAAALARLDVARRRAEAAARRREEDLAATADTLARSQALVARIAESGLVGIVVADPSGDILEANDAFLGMIGYSRDDLLTGGIAAASLTPPDWQAAQAVARAELAASGATTPWEKELVRKDGTRVPVLIRVATSSLGDRPSIVNVIVDLTDLKKVEQDRARLDAEARRELAGREHAEAAVRTMEEQLRQSQKMDAIGRLAGGVAHDFNNLLTVIIGTAEMILADGPAGEPAYDDVGEIRKAAERAAHLTHQLLLFSRHQVVKREILDLNTLLSGMDRMLRRLVGEDVEMTTRPTAAKGQVMADPGSLEQVVLNLVVNARDAMPTGGKLTIETGDVLLDERYAAEHLGVKAGPHVMLAVSDTGAGMDREVQARIFEPFFTTKERGKGTGLGLSTVFGIVQQSEGSVWVYSEPGKGTTFKIYLPLAPDPVDEARPRAAPAALRGSETILLVEDEEQVRAVALSILERRGYRVLAAQNAQEALSLCEKHHGEIDLLVSDVVMPQMSGPELARHVAVVRPATKVLCMSGYTDDAVVRHGALEGGIAFIQKPFTPDTLARKVREVLDGEHPEA